MTICKVHKIRFCAKGSFFAPPCRFRERKRWINSFLLSDFYEERRGKRIQTIWRWIKRRKQKMCKGKWVWIFFKIFWSYREWALTSYLDRHALSTVFKVMKIFQSWDSMTSRNFKHPLNVSLLLGGKENLKIFYNHYKVCRSKRKILNIF